MSPRLERLPLPDGSFIESSIDRIAPDRWRSHGVKYRLAWIQDGECRVLFDNHHGKGDHIHIDGKEYPYAFISVEQLSRDFETEVRKLGGRL